jgi:hypothetical protein
MISKDFMVRAVSLVLLGFGLFQIIASMVGFVFLLLTGHWTDHIPQIVPIALGLTLPITYLVWKKYLEAKRSP